MEQQKTFIHKMAGMLIDLRWIWLTILMVITGLFFIYQIPLLEQKAGFEKQVPHEHRYMDAYNDWKTTFAGNNRVLIALMVRPDAEYKNIFNTEFMQTLRSVSDEVSLMNGIDRAKVKSLFTADRRYIEVVEGGFEGGSVVPTEYYAGISNYQKTCEAVEQSVLDRVESNAFKAADTPGRFVTRANDQGNVIGAMVDAEVLEKDPFTNVPVDPKLVAQLLERQVREKYQNDNISIHIIGFSKVVGDIVEAIGIDKVAQAAESYSNAWGGGSAFRDEFAEDIANYQEQNKNEVSVTDLTNRVNQIAAQHNHAITQNSDKSEDLLEKEEENDLPYFNDKLIYTKVYSPNDEGLTDLVRSIKRLQDAVETSYYADNGCYAMLAAGDESNEGFNKAAPFYTMSVEAPALDDNGNEITKTMQVAYKTAAQIDEEALNGRLSYNEDYWEEQFECASAKVGLVKQIEKINDALVALKEEIPNHRGDEDQLDDDRETAYQLKKSLKDKSAALTKLRAVEGQAYNNTRLRKERMLAAIAASVGGDGESAATGVMACGAGTGGSAGGDDLTAKLSLLTDNLSEIESDHISDARQKILGGDGKAGAVQSVVFFFLYTMILAGVLLYIYCGSFKLTMVPIVSAVLAVIWQFGMLITLGELLVHFRVNEEIYGIDPMSILVPFLVFAIGVSHGVQMINSYMEEIIKPGMTGKEATKETLAKLLVPASTALVSDTVGFLTIIAIPVDTIREMAITASMGVGVILVTNLVFLPILLSFVNIKNIEKYTKKVERRQNFGTGFWRLLSGLTSRKPAIVTIIVTAGLFAFGFIQGDKVAIGDLAAGVPALSQKSVYNQDNKMIVDSFDIGTDIVQIIAEAPANGCIRYDVMSQIYDFQGYVNSLPGVNTAITAPAIARQVSAATFEGSLKWRALSRIRESLVGAMQPLDSGTGLINADCSAMPVLIFTKDHKADTLSYITAKIEKYNEEQEKLYASLSGSNVLSPKPPPPRAGDVDFVDSALALVGDTSGGADETVYDYSRVNFRLATGNAGVEAATNETVAEQQLPILFYVYAAIIALCLIMFWIQFKSPVTAVMAMLCVVLPLLTVSYLGYAVMYYLDIGLKVATLPVVALGVGIGIDYGIYIFGTMGTLLMQGRTLRESYFDTLQLTGKAVLFTAVTLALGVGTWVLSDLQFQVDMGKMLFFMFFVNMLAAVIVVPALAHFLIRVKPNQQSTSDS